MRIPEGMTEEEVTATILKVAKRLARRFVFGCYPEQDIVQEAFRIGIEGLEKYDPNRPLENFMSIHIRNRLGNVKRKLYERLEKPCDKCPLDAYRKDNPDFPSECAEYQDKMECDLYKGWYNRNASKKSLMTTFEFGEFSGEDSPHEREAAETAELAKEVIDRVEKELPAAYREDWLRLKYGTKIPNARKGRLLKIIREILDPEDVTEEEREAV